MILGRRGIRRDDMPIHYLQEAGTTSHHYRPPCTETAGHCDIRRVERLYRASSSCTGVAVLVGIRLVEMNKQQQWTRSRRRIRGRRTEQSELFGPRPQFGPVCDPPCHENIRRRTQQRHHQHSGALIDASDPGAALQGPPSTTSGIFEK